MTYFIRQLRFSHTVPIKHSIVTPSVQLLQINTCRHVLPHLHVIDLAGIFTIVKE